MHTKNPVIPSFDETRMLESVWLRQVCLDAGADDVGFVPVESPALADERPHVERAFPRTRTLVSLVVRMNRDNIRSPARSVANNEFHHATDEANEVARRVVAALERASVRALNPPSGFPMEADRWMSERMWVVAHKPVAVAAGMGRMGIHRNVIHPQFGNFILLATVLVAAEVDVYGRELDYNPCLTCKLCVAACPVGAIGADGAFNFSACMTHNYHEFMGGFGSWVETIADSRNGRDYRRRVRDSETVSQWQSLAFGPNYKAAYCLAVCPAGTDIIGLYQNTKKQFADEVMRPLLDKEEDIFVIAGSDAEAHVRRRFPHKTVRPVRSSLRPRNLNTLLQGLSLSFQPQAAKGLEATFHFTFTGAETREATVEIRRQRLKVSQGLVGTPTVQVTADTESWLRFIRGETGILWPLFRRRVRVRGSLRLLQAFGRCFPN